jgi:hypothetical protein
MIETLFYLPNEDLLALHPLVFASTPSTPITKQKLGILPSYNAL